MILYAVAPDATSVSFSVTTLFPFCGLALDFISGDFSTRPENADLDRFVFESSSRFSAPNNHIFWAYVNETDWFDGKYLVAYQPNNGSSPAGAYSVSVLRGVEQFANGPVRTAPDNPPLCKISGREISVSGVGLSNATISASISNGDGTGINPLGNVSGFSTTTTDIDGLWSIDVIPSEYLVPQARYRIAISHPNLGQKTYDNLLVPSAPAADIKQVFVNTAVRDMEIEPSEVTPVDPPELGYCRVSGRIVDANGKPQEGYKLLFNTANSHEPGTYAVNLPFPNNPIKNHLMVERLIEVVTKRHRLGTVSADVFSPTSSLFIPPTSQLMSVTDGYGREYKNNREFTYNSVSKEIKFKDLFVGVVKYIEQNGGVFYIDLPIGHEYYVQIGDLPVRKPFTICDSQTSLDLGTISIHS